MSPRSCRALRSLRWLDRFEPLQQPTDGIPDLLDSCPVYLTRTQPWLPAGLPVVTRDGLVTTQPLAEASISPLVALAVYVYVTANSNYWRWMLLIVIAALLVCCRPTFVLLLPLIRLAYVAHVTPRQIGTVARAAGIAALGFALWLLGKHLLEPNVSVSYLQVIGSDGPDFSNMTNFFDLSPQPPTISAIVANVVKGLAIQFTKIDAGYALFYLPFNVLALAPLVLLRGSRRTEVTRVAAAGLVAVGLHLITALLVRNQFRYLLVATPPLLVAAGVVLARAELLRTIRTSAALMTAAMLTLATPSATLAWRSITKALKLVESAQISRTRSARRCRPMKP